VDAVLPWVSVLLTVPVIAKIPLQDRCTGMAAARL
jgi:hypothetical protein